MEINHRITNQLESKSMSESISSIYESLCRILTTHCKLNTIAMSKTHVMGYNGFKRWHRCRSRQFHEMKLYLLNELYDKFRISLTFRDYELSYSPGSIQEHLRLWDKTLLDTIQELGELNKKYYELTGLSNCIIEKVTCEIVRDYEKVGRLLKRFSESDWLAIDIHIVDDKLHEKYKQKENEYGFKY